MHVENSPKSLAEEQRKSMTHDLWLTKQVNAAFDKLDSGNANFIDHDEAKAQMEARKTKIRNRVSA